MLSITQQSVPESSLLKTYRGGLHPDAWGTYSDCFSVPIERTVSLADFVYAFYTTPIFRIERRIIHALVKIASTDEQARQLAEGSRNDFAAWRLAQRTDSQLLLGDIRDQTRSWLAVTPTGTAQRARTLLQFGSGIAAQQDPRTGQQKRSLGFRLLGGFHVVYSQVLLHSARRRLENETYP